MIKLGAFLWLVAGSLGTLVVTEVVPVPWLMASGFLIGFGIAMMNHEGNRL